MVANTTVNSTLAGVGQVLTLNTTTNVSTAAMPDGASLHLTNHGGHVVHHPHNHQHPQNPHAVLVLYLVLFTLFGAQLGLVVWKKKHKRSYEAVTLLGLWLIPAMISWHLHFWRFVVVWGLFSASIGYLLYLCNRPILDPTTPRNVFSWFLICHKACIAVGSFGYALLLCEVLGLAPLIWMLVGKMTSILLLWYGLYFGVLGRDCAELVSDRMAARMGYGQKLAVTPNRCGLCQKDLNDFSHINGEEPPEATFQLACKHTFHELCIKGWTMVGKKDVCPVCMEKVDLKALYADRPWETRNLHWISMLDAVRYLVVWNPIILTALHFAMHFTGLDEDPSVSPPPPQAIAGAPPLTT